MPDGSTPASQAGSLFQQITSIAEDTSYAAEDRLARIRELIALGPCPDCGSTDEGHATPCGRPKTAQQVQAGNTSIKLPAAVDHVMHERRNRLFQIRALFAGAFAMAEAADDSSDVRWAMEAALELFEEAVDSLEPLCICRDAQEVANGLTEAHPRKVELES